MGVIEIDVVDQYTKGSHTDVKHEQEVDQTSPFYKLRDYPFIYHGDGPIAGTTLSL